MRRFTSYVLTLAMLLGLAEFSSVFSQDTTFVQTFTFSDITKRRDVYTFPDGTTEYSKILMYKTLKCDAATTQDNYPCGEWDYLTYTYVYDHTGVLDSNAGTHPLYLGGGFDFDTVYTHATPMYDVYQYEQTVRVIDSVIADSSATSFSGTSTTTNVLASGNATGRYQFLMKENVLNSAGLAADTIDRITFNIDVLGSELKHLTIRMANYSGSSLSEFQENNLVTVYDQHTTFSSTGLQTLNLTSPFKWTGNHAILVDISFTNIEDGTSTELHGKSLNDSLGVYSNNADGYATFEDHKRIEVPMNNTDFGDEITVSFWLYGNENVLPSNTSAFEAADENNNRIAQAHLPWSNSGVYWDAGEGSGYDRINKTANSSEIGGQWNHWAFTKNAATGVMNIYLNGTLWRTGSDKNRSVGEISKFHIGRGRNNYPYYGNMDEFAVWKKELSQTEISDWMNKDITSSHPKYSDLMLYFKFDNGYTLVNDAPTSYVGYWHGAPGVQQYRGTERHRISKRTVVVPEITFSQGSYEDTTYTMTVSDTVMQAPFSVVEYAQQGNGAHAINGTYTSPEGYSYVYDANGNAIDSTFFAGSTMWVNGDVNFFYPQFEIVDRYEIGRFITPYGIGLTLGPDGFTWVYDVTDYAFLLQDDVDISSGNQQELLDLKFAFIEGTPPAHVVDFNRPWGQSRSIRYADLDDDVALEPVTVNVHPDASRQKVITRLTGHGHNSNSGNYPHCCEWKDNTHYLWIDNVKAADWHIWQTHDCALNPVYPQGGTWPGAREGWCPGDLVKDFEFDITDDISSDSFEIDYRITPVPSNNQGMGDGRYVVATHVIQYDEPANEYDAEVYDVIRPNSRGYFSRLNPVCYAPSIILRNNGSKTMTNAMITYKVSGGHVRTFKWTGVLGFLEKEEVVLPFENGAFYAGDGSNKFEVTVSEPNGQTDGNPDNSTFVSSFELPPVYSGKVIIQYKTNTYYTENDLKVYDATNTLKLAKIGTSLAANTTYFDTLDLDSGCYRMEITDKQDDGLSYWANGSQGSGYVRLWSESGGILKTFESEFGNKIDFAFTIDSLSSSKYHYEPEGVAETYDSEGEISVYPNPNNGRFYLELMNFDGQYNMEIVNIAGQVIHAEELNVKGGYISSLNLGLPAGMYTVRLSDGESLKVKKFIVE